MSQNESDINPQPETIPQFATRVRSKYAGAYDGVPDGELVDRYLRKNPVYADRVQLPDDFKLLRTTSGDSKLDSLYEQAGRENNLDPNLLLEQGRVESVNFNPKWIYKQPNPLGYGGIAQLGKEEAATYGAGVDPQTGKDGRFDPARAIPAQAKMMRHLLDRHNGNTEAALASYVAGSNYNTAQALQARQRNGQARSYVDKITGAVKSLPIQLGEDFTPQVKAETANPPSVDASLEQPLPSQPFVAPAENTPARRRQIRQPQPQGSVQDGTVRDAQGNVIAVNAGRGRTAARSEVEPQVVASIAQTTPQPATQPTVPISTPVSAPLQGATVRPMRRRASAIDEADLKANAAQIPTQPAYGSQVAVAPQLPTAQFVKSTGENRSGLENMELGARAIAGLPNDLPGADSLSSGKSLRVELQSDKQPTQDQLSDAAVKAMGAVGVNEKYRQETGHNIVTPNLSTEDLQYDPKTKTYSFMLDPVKQDYDVVNAYAKGGLAAAQEAATNARAEQQKAIAEMRQQRDFALKTLHDTFGIKPEDVSEANGAAAKGLADTALGLTHLLNNVSSNFRDPASVRNITRQAEETQGQIPEEKSFGGRAVRGVTGLVSSLPEYGLLGASPGGAAVIAYMQNRHKGPGEAIKAALEMYAAGKVLHSVGGRTAEWNPIARQIAARGAAGTAGMAMSVIGGERDPVKIIEQGLPMAAMPIGRGRRPEPSTVRPLGEAPQTPSMVAENEGTLNDPNVQAGIRNAREAVAQEVQGMPRRAGLATMGEQLQAKGVVPPEVTTEPSKTIIRHADPRIDGDEVVGKTSDGKLLARGEDGVTHTVQNPRTQGNQLAAIQKVGENVSSTRDRVPTIEESQTAEVVSPSDRAQSPQGLAIQAPIRADAAEGLSGRVASQGQGEAVASVPFMITRAMRADLKGRGYADTDIDKMTPQQGRDVLSVAPRPIEAPPEAATPAEAVAVKQGGDTLPVSKRQPELMSGKEAEGQGTPDRRPKEVVPQMSLREYRAKAIGRDEMVRQGAGGSLSSAIRTEIPIDKIDGLEPVPEMEGGYKKGTPITQPIEVEYDPVQDKYMLYAGNHRVEQARANGDAMIPAFVERVDFSSATPKQTEAKTVKQALPTDVGRIPRQLRALADDARNYGSYAEWNASLVGKAKSLNSSPSVLVGEAGFSGLEQFYRSAVANKSSKPSNAPSLRAQTTSQDSSPPEAVSPLREGVKQPKAQNFTQFASERGLPSDYDVLEHGLLGESGSMSKRSKNFQMDKMSDRIAQNRQAHQEYEQAILRGDVVDPSGKLTSEGLQKDVRQAELEKPSGRLRQIASQVANIESMGSMSHLPSGKLKRGYQRTVDIYNAEKAQIFRDYPELQPQKQVAPQTEPPPETPSFAEARQVPKGGAVKMDAAGVQATAAEALARKFGLQPRAVYEWATRHQVDLVADGAKLSQAESGLTEAVINDSPLPVSDEARAQQFGQPHVEKSKSFIDNPESQRIIGDIENGKSSIRAENRLQQIAKSSGLEDAHTDEVIKQAKAISEQKPVSAGDRPGAEPSNRTAEPSTAPARNSRRTAKSPTAESTGAEPPTVGSAGAGDTRSLQPEDVTGGKVAVTREEREVRGLNPVERQAYLAAGDSYLSGKQEVETGRIEPRGLAESVAENPRPLSAKETGALIYDRARLKNEQKAIYDDINKAVDAGDEKVATQGRERLQQNEKAFDANDKALELGGREWSMAGQARKTLVKSDYSIAEMIQSYKAETGKEPSPRVRAQIEAQSKRIAELEKQIAEHEEQGKRSDAQDGLDRIKDEVAREGRRTRRASTRADLDTEFAQLSTQFSKHLETKLHANPLDPELVKIIGKMAKNRVLAGVNTIEGLVDAVHAQVKDYLDDKRAIRDAISGYGKEKQSRQVEEWQKTLNDLKSQMRGLSKQEDEASGLREKASLKAQKTRLQNSINEYERKIREGDFTPPTRRQIEHDRQSLDLLTQVGRVKEQYENLKQQEIRRQRPLQQKILDTAVKGRRAVALSSSWTLGKLTSAATQRLGITPIEEIEGGFMSMLPGLKTIARQAPSEGGFRASAESQAIARAWRTYLEAFKPEGEIRQALKTGKTSIDVLYGGKRELPPEALDFIGHLHSALKAPAKLAQWERSMSKNLDWLRKQGKDISDPAVREWAGARSFVDANRAVLMQDNMLSDGFSQMLSYLNNRGALGRVTAAAGRLIFPVTKVAPNFVKETLNYTLGGVNAMTRMAAATKFFGGEGLKNLTPDQADGIMRAFKKQGLGVALFALGVLNRGSIGGYGSRKDEKDVQAGGMRIFGWDVPSWLLHTPPLEVMQMGATYGRTLDAKGTKPEEAGLAAATLKTGVGLAREIPFFEEPMQAGSHLDNYKSASTFAGSMAGSMITPPDVARAAKVFDPNQPTTAGRKIAQMAGIQPMDAVKRRPQNFGQAVEMGWPGARQNVPVNNLFGTARTPGSVEAQRLNLNVGDSKQGGNESVETFQKRQAEVNPLVNSALDSLLRDRRYGQLSDDNKKKVFSDVVRRVRENDSAKRNASEPLMNNGKLNRDAPIDIIDGAFKALAERRAKVPQIVPFSKILVNRPTQ